MSLKGEAMMKTMICLVSAVVCILTASNGHAGVVSVKGTEFSSSMDVPGTHLKLSGAALLKYMVFIEVYTGALYLPDNTDGSDALNDIPKHLVLEYRVKISSDDFAKATMAQIKASVSKAVFHRLVPKIESLNRLYEDVKPQDRYALTYLPGRGTQLTLNAVPLGTIDGSEFAKALFGIWLGENPIDETFRDRLLGKIK